MLLRNLRIAKRCRSADVHANRSLHDVMDPMQAQGVIAVATWVDDGEPVDVVSDREAARVLNEQRAIRRFAGAAVTRMDSGAPYAWNTRPSFGSRIVLE